MTDRFIYPATIKKDRSGFWLIQFPDLPGAATDSNSRTDALREAIDCLEEAIAHRILKNLDIPLPSPASGKMPRIALPAQMAAKAALYLALKESGRSMADLANALGVHHGEVRRMLNPRHPTKLPRIEAALAVLGKRLVVDMRAA